MAQSEARMPCHAQFEDGLDYAAAQEHGTYEHTAPQCAGRAIHWANQLKLPRDQTLLQLPPDHQTVFSWPHEFIAHHKGQAT
jgi:hypothetical protein